MIIGQTIVAVDLGSQEPTTVFTPWIASWGNSAIFSYEILQWGGAAYEFAVEVYTKNSEDVDPGTKKGSTSTATGADTYSITDADGLLELVRLKCVLTPSAAASGGIATAYVHLRMLNPSWKPN